MFNAAREAQTLRTPRSTVMISDAPHPRHDSRAASFFGAMAFLVGLVLVMAAMAALSGCDRPLTNQEIVQQVEYCRAHHLKPVQYSNMASGDQVFAVQCQADP